MRRLTFFLLSVICLKVHSQQSAFIDQGCYIYIIDTIQVSSSYKVRFQSENGGVMLNFYNTNTSYIDSLVDLYGSRFPLLLNEGFPIAEWRFDDLGGYISEATNYRTNSKLKLKMLLNFSVYGRSIDRADTLIETIQRDSFEKITIYKSYKRTYIIALINQGFYCSSNKYYPWFLKDGDMKFILVAFPSKSDAPIGRITDQKHF